MCISPQVKKKKSGKHLVSQSFTPNVPSNFSLVKTHASFVLLDIKITYFSWHLSLSLSCFLINMSNWHRKVSFLLKKINSVYYLKNTAKTKLKFKLDAFCALFHCSLLYTHKPKIKQATMFCLQKDTRVRSSSDLGTFRKVSRAVGCPLYKIQGRFFWLGRKEGTGIQRMPGSR